MKKIFPVILVAVVLFNFNTAYSQANLTLNGGVQLPTGDFGNVVKSGYGFSASIGYSFPLVPLELDLTAGYNNWPYKTQISLSNSGMHEFGTGMNLYSIPVMIGPKVFLPFPLFIFKLYLGIDAGIVSSSSNATGATSTTNFIYSPMVGFRLGLPPGIIALDVNIKVYNYKDKDSGNTISWLGVNGGIAVSL